MSNPLIMNVDFGGAVGLINLGPFLLNKFEINLPYHNSTWGAIKSSAKFTLTDLTNEVYGYFIDYIDNYIPVQVYLDTVRIFRGYIRNNASFTTNEGLDDISLELIDRSKELDVTLEETISLENAKICDTATPASSVIHQLIYASGYADALAFGITLEAFGIVDGADYNAFGIENADLSLLTDIDISIDYYFKSKFDDHNIYKLIQDILFEAGYVLIVTATGEPYFASIIGRGETPTTTTFYDKKIFKGFKWRKQDVKFDSVTMKYYDHDLIENAVVFNDTTGGNDLYDCIIPVPATTSYPVDAELPATITKLDFAVNTPDLTDPTAVNKRDLIVAIQLGAEVDVRPGSFFNPAKAISDDTWYGTSLDSGAYNADSAGHNLIRFQVIADAIVKGDMHEYIAKKQLVSKYSNKDVELEHITDAANAKVLADGLLDNYVYGKKVFNFNTTESLVLGNYYIVTDGAYTGAAYNFKVIRKTPVYVWTKAYGLAIYYYKYECLSYGVLAAIDTGGGSTTGRTVTRARRIFRDTLFEAEVPAVINPEAPYFLLDLWIKDDGYYECTTARASGDAYVDGDFTRREINPAEVPLALLHDPARLGAILESPTPDDVFLHAIDHTGANILDEDGKVMFDGVYKTVPYGAVPVADGTWYMFKETSGGTVQLAQYDFTTAQFEVGGGEMTAGFFFAEVIAVGGIVTSIDIYQTAKSEAEMVAHYKRLTMQILAAASVGDFGAIATGLGIEAAFTSLAVYNAFIVDLIVQKFLATKVDGANTFLLYADIINGLKMKYGTTGSEDTLFHVDINGDITLGDYAGNRGIFWDASENKLLGNVAYDEWDLVIQSDADLALLQYVATSPVQYARVLITKGTWTTTELLDLDNHGVEAFVGLGRQSIIDLNFLGTTAKASINGGTALKDIGNFYATSSFTQTAIGFNVIEVTLGTNCNFSDIYVAGFGGFGYGITSSLASTSDITVTRCVVDGCYIGFAYLAGISQCQSDNNTIHGFWGVNGITNCTAQNNQHGFSYCNRVAGCYTKGNTSGGFSVCREVGSCYAHEALAGYGFSGCTNLSYFSTNSDQVLGYGNHSIVANGYWTIPARNFIFASETYFRLEIKDSGGTWRTAGGNFGGMVVSDGANLRIHNNNLFITVTAHYRYMN